MYHTEFNKIKRFVTPTLLLCFWIVLCTSLFLGWQSLPPESKGKMLYIFFLFFLSSKLDMWFGTMRIYSLNWFRETSGKDFFSQIKMENPLEKCFLITLLPLLFQSPAHCYVSPLFYCFCSQLRSLNKDTYNIWKLAEHKDGKFLSMCSHPTLQLCFCRFLFTFSFFKLL